MYGWKLLKAFAKAFFAIRSQLRTEAIEVTALGRTPSSAQAATARVAAAVVDGLKVQVLQIVASGRETP
jgi:hypothetical protein